GARVGAARGAEPRMYGAPQGHAVRAERAAELHDEIALEVRQREITEVRIHAIGVVAYDLARLRVDVHVARYQEARGLNHDIRARVRRKCEAQEATVVGGRDLGADAPRPARLQIHGVI